MNRNRKQVILFILSLIPMLLIAGITVAADGASDEAASHINADHLVINEVCSNNFSVIHDESGFYHDYVELYNPCDEALGMGMYLSDDPAHLQKYRIEEHVPAHGFLLIWLSGQEPGGYLHAPFGVKRSGERLLLSDDNGSVVDALTVPETVYDTAYSRLSDGTGSFHHSVPTPNTSNIGAKTVSESSVAAPVFSLEDGFYDSGTLLKIKGGLFHRVYYTTDGTAPDENASLYTGPIVLTDASDRNNLYAEEMMYPTYTPPLAKVDKCNVIRAIAVNRFTKEKSPVESHVYFCGFDQKPEYDDVEVLSLVVDPEELFGYDRGIFALGKKYDEYLEMGGFEDLDASEVPDHFVDSTGQPIFRYEYTNAAYRGRESERVAVMSVFDRNHILRFDQKVGIRVAGESSRYSYQKSLNLRARDIYEGSGSFHHGFFLNNEEKVRLRRGDSALIFQEAFLQSVGGGLGLIFQGARPEAVFINGEYWGVYNLTEQYDASFFLNHYGIPEESVWLIKNDVPEYGGNDAYESYNHALSMIVYADAGIPEVYEAICEQVDIDSLIDYFCTQIFFDNIDIHPRHNQMLFKAGAADKWQWILYDLDMTCNDASSDTIAFYRGLGDDMYLPGCLYENASFQERFRTRMVELVNGAFSYETLHDQLMAWDRRYRDQSIATNRRFHHMSYDQAEREYLEELERIDSFLKLRKTYVLQYLAQDMALH